jgi:hypothetical protein
MAAARAEGPQRAWADDPPRHEIPPVISHGAPRPRAAQWRAPRHPGRPIARWLGIGGGLVLVSLLTATVLTQPIGTEIERLVRPWLEGWQDREVAAPRPAPILPAEPQRAARDDRAGGSTSADGARPEQLQVLARDSSAAFGGPRAGAPAGPPAARADDGLTPPAAAAPAPASDHSPAAAVPIPSLKPAVHR